MFVAQDAAFVSSVAERLVIFWLN